MVSPMIQQHLSYQESPFSCSFSLADQYALICSEDTRQTSECCAGIEEFSSGDKTFWNLSGRPVRLPYLLHEKNDSPKLCEHAEDGRQHHAESQLCQGEILQAFQNPWYPYSTSLVEVECLRCISIWILSWRAPYLTLEMSKSTTNCPKQGNMFANQMHGLNFTWGCRRRLELWRHT